MTSPHTVKAFDQDLQALSDGICAMGGCAATQLEEAVQALLTGDARLAARVVDQDRQLDALRRDLSSAAARVIARRQPFAQDLEEVMADFRIVEDLERIGDLAKNIAKRAKVIASADLPADLLDSFAKLAELAGGQLRDALVTYQTRDAAGALAVRKLDETLDEAHTDVFRNIIDRMGSDQNQVIGFVHLLFCAKNVERIGDHATHIAEAAYLRATRSTPTDERQRLDRSSLVGGEDAD